MEFFKKTNFDFIGNRKIAYIISISLAVMGAIAIIVRGGLNFGIDFEGGTLIQMKIQPMPEMGDVRDVLVNNQIKGAQVQNFHQADEIIIRIKKEVIMAVEPVYSESQTNTSGETLAALTEPTSALPESLLSATTVSSAPFGQSPRMGGIEQKFYDMFLKAFPDTKIEITRVEMVGPAVGKKLLNQAMWALFWGLIGIMVYVGWRFEFKYSAPAVLALVHDVFIVTSLFALLNKEIDMTTIAALLTIAGYSINDTIVIYDRIREKIRLFAKDEIGKVMNLAINDTLGRTAITGISAILVLLSIFFAGGEVIHNFAFALLIGTIIGTYSSIFVASPLIYEWEMRHKK